jgi:hypothetical protein
MQLLGTFLRDQRGFSEARLPDRWARFAAALLILNEIRGVIVAWSIALQVWG